MSILKEAEKKEAFDYANMMDKQPERTEEQIKEELYDNFLINSLITKRKEEAANKAGDELLTDLRARQKAQALHTH